MFLFAWSESYAAPQLHSEKLMNVQEIPKTWTDSRKRKRTFVDVVDNDGIMLVVSKHYHQKTLWKYEVEYIQDVEFQISLTEKAT